MLLLKQVVRDARVANETLTVEVAAVADTLVVAATAAYKARDVILDLLPNETVLGNKLVVPAGGYLVIVVDAAAAAIPVPSANLKGKVSAASKLYNVFDSGDKMLEFPADDLDNFFRNGGTLTLGYADIPAATGSGHGDSKRSLQWVMTTIRLRGCYNGRIRRRCCDHQRNYVGTRCW